MRIIRSGVAFCLWWLCTFLDYVPTIERGRVMFGDWGCRLGLSRLAAKVEEIRS